MNEYTVTIKIPCIVYKDVYVNANNQKDASNQVKGWILDQQDVDNFGGDYGDEQLFEKSVIITSPNGHK